MRIIDEKGRLFSKINIIDFLVILFLFALAPMFYFGYKIFTQKPPEVKKDFIEIEINSNFIKVNPETLGLIKVGDKALDGYGGQIGEITWLGESRPYIYKFAVALSEIEDKMLKELPVKLKLKAEIKNNNLYYNGQQIITASPLVFETNKYNLVAIPTVKKRWVTVTVKFQELLPELSNVINAGDIERDNENKVIGVLKKVLVKKPSGVKYVELKRKQLALLDNLFSTDAIILLNLLCTDRDGVLYFKDYPLKIGNPINFTTDVYAMSGIIIGLDLRQSDAGKNN